MHLGEKDVAAVLAAATAAENDLFLVPDAPFLPSHAEALSAALGLRVVVFLPGDYYPFGQDPTRCFFYAPHDCVMRIYRFPPSPSVCWADIRLTGDPAFCAALKVAGPAAWVLPFAECADVFQPNFRESYRYLAELRAESPCCIGLAALFDTLPDADGFMSIFGSRSAVLLNGAPARSFPAVEAETEAQKLRLTIGQCARQLCKRTAVFFPTRRQAEAFSRMLLRRDVSCVSAHGGKTHGANALALARFLAGEVPVLVTTGHALASAPFLSADRVICCGLPHTASVAARCAALLPAGEEPLIVFTRADIAFNARLSGSYAAALALPEEDFLARRRALSEELLRMLRL